TTASTGSGLHFFAMVTFGSGIEIKWFGTMSLVFSIQNAVMRFSISPLRGICAMMRSKEECRSVETSTSFPSCSYMSRTLPVFFGPSHLKSVSRRMLCISFSWRWQHDVFWFKDNLSLAFLHDAGIPELVSSFFP